MLDPVAIDYLEYLDPYLKMATWEQHFCVIPRRCVFTNKLMWLCKCYRGKRAITKVSRVEYYYATYSSLVMWALK